MPNVQQSKRANRVPILCEQRGSVQSVIDEKHLPLFTNLNAVNMQNRGVSCLECHKAVEGQETQAHKGFTIAKHLTAKNCSECHSTEYTQFLRSRHAAPAWAAVSGARDFTTEQIAFAEKYHKGAVNRPPNPLAIREGESAINVGCLGCHDIGKPNNDGSIGTCTDCHARHSTSIALAREPETCGQCHMGPDHSQIEIYHESKHGGALQCAKRRYEPKSTAQNANHRGYVRANMCDLSLERLGWIECNARYNGKAFILVICSYL